MTIQCCHEYYSIIYEVYKNANENIQMSQLFPSLIVLFNSQSNYLEFKKYMLQLRDMCSILNLTGLSCALCLTGRKVLIMRTGTSHDEMYLHINELWSCSATCNLLMSNHMTWALSPSLDCWKIVGSCRGLDNECPALELRWRVGLVPIIQLS